MEFVWFVLGCLAGFCVAKVVESYRNFRPTSSDDLTLAAAALISMEEGVPPTEELIARLRARGEEDKAQIVERAEEISAKSATRS